MGREAKKEGDCVREESLRNRKTWRKEERKKRTDKVTLEDFTKCQPVRGSKSGPGSGGCQTNVSKHRNI